MCKITLPIIGLVFHVKNSTVETLGPTLKKKNNGNRHKMGSGCFVCLKNEAKYVESVELRQVLISLIDQIMSKFTSGFSGLCFFCWF